MAEYATSGTSDGCPGVSGVGRVRYCGRSALTAALLTALTLLVAGCATSASDPSARYFSTKPVTSSPPARPDEGSTEPVVPGATASPVARPNPGLTPGVVAVRDPNVVCEQPMRVRTQTRYTDYGLDYLVPLNLGGAPEMANLWPVPVNDVGFHEKARLNYKLRLVVCRGELPLDEAQQQIAKDWYSLWSRYVA